MGTTLKAGKKEECQKPKKHSCRSSQSYHAETCFIACHTKDSSIEEDSTDLYAGESTSGQDVPSYLHLCPISETILGESIQSVLEQIAWP